MINWESKSEFSFRLNEIIQGWPASNASSFLLDIENQSVLVAGDSEYTYQYASVSKLASALGFLSAISEGVFDLDQQLPNGLIVSDLFSHCSGLPSEIDHARPIFDQIPVVPPRTRRIYSNAGFEMLAAYFESLSGFTFADYIYEVVFAPCQMHGATMDSSVWPSAGPSGAAAGITGSLRDLLGLTQGLINGTPFIESSLLSKAKIPFQPDLPGILPGFGEFSRNLWGLGMEIKGEKTPHWTSKSNSNTTYGHFGAAGTFLWVDPDFKLALGVLTDRPFGPWAQKSWPELSNFVLDNFAGGP